MKRRRLRILEAQTRRLANDLAAGRVHVCRGCKASSGMCFILEWQPSLSRSGGNGGGPHGGSFTPTARRKTVARGPLQTSRILAAVIDPTAESGGLHDEPVYDQAQRLSDRTLR